MSSASGTSPVSSESNPEGFGNYNTILRSGRSLDQLYKFSIDEDIDISNEKIQNQSNTTNNELGEIGWVFIESGSCGWQCDADGTGRIT